MTDPLDGIVLVDKPAGQDLARRRRRACAASSACARPGTPARSTRSRPGCCSSCSAARTRVQRFFMALPKTYVAVARFGAVSTTGDPDGELTETGRAPGTASCGCPTGQIRQRPPAYRAIRVGGGAPYERARRGRGRSRCPSARSTVYAFEQLWREGDRAGFEIECSSGTYVRTLIADLGDAYCVGAAPHARSARSTSPTPTPSASCRSPSTLGMFRSAALDGDDARKAAHGVAVPAPRAVPSRGGVARARPAGRGPAVRRRRPDRARQEPRRRPAQARRRLPRVKIVPLPDAEPRPRRVAIGTFDGVHLGHRAVIEGADTVLTFDPHPRLGDLARERAASCSRRSSASASGSRRSASRSSS